MPLPQKPHLKVLIYHPVILPVLKYGGTERVLMWLAKSLVELGHSVTLFAAKGSNPIPPYQWITDEEELLKRAHEFSLVHSFTKLSQKIEDAFQGRVITTIQGNGQLGERFHKNTVFVSKNHAERHGSKAYVYNGLDPEELLFNDQVRPDRYLFLSKTNWKVKNLKGAVGLCHRYKKNLWIAGGEGPLYLKVLTQFKSFLGKDWKWVGSVGQSQKANFLIQGKAMIFPIVWNEPFGIVMTESLVSGTPFLGSPYGSVPEILEFAPQCLMKSDQDWENALTGQIKFPHARECRQWVLEKFDRKLMGKNYVSLYEKVMNGESINSTEPVTKITAQDLRAQGA